jgi:SAM-dependent methyltransferase
VFLKKTRAVWKRRAQSRLFDLLGMQGLLDEREHHELEDMMGFRGQLEEHRRFQIDELKKLGLTSSSSVLEIGCGPLTAGIPVIAFLEAGRYVGVDVRSNVLDLSWQQVGRKALSAKNPRLIRADDFGVAEVGDRKFDFIWSFSVLYHLSDDILDRLFGSVAGLLADGGLFIANVQTEMEDSRWLEFPFLKRSVEIYDAVGKKHHLVMTNLGTIEERGFRLAGEERKNPLLKFERS